jgi:glycosyltransferase involved in cell wall biosynthesis
MMADCISIIVPVYNEKGNIAACLRGLTKALQGIEHEILVCYDFDEDTTLPAIAEMPDRPSTVKLVRNTLGRGATFAIRAGFHASRGDVLVTTMADLSDPPDAVPAMARKIREERADVVSGSRYMKGGSQMGGPGLKTFLSRAAGLSLFWIAGMGTHDATTNFRAYSRRFIDQVSIESRSGMDLALELTVKAHLLGFKVDELPSSWQDRSSGESRFRMWNWIPNYLRWYLQAMGDPLIVWTVFLVATIAAVVFAVVNAPVIPFWDDWANVPVLTGHRPLSLEWLWVQHFEHRIPLGKLVWIVVLRMSGGDPRWMTALIALLLSMSSALLLRGLMKFRGKSLWTDAFVPLLFLHWDHWENLTWPFQISFAMHALFVSLLISLLLRTRRVSIASMTVPVGLCLMILPLCGGSTLPFLLVAPWWAWVSYRQTRLLSSIALPTAALLLSAGYFVGYRRLSDGPPSPGFRASVTVAWEFLTGSLGVEGTRHWPTSGALTLIALAFTFAVLLRCSRRQDDRSIPAGGLLLVLVGVVVLAGLVGNLRAGSSLFAGFFDRYVTLSCLFPFMVYMGAELCGPPLLGRVLRTVLVAAMALFFRVNGEHALDLLAQRRLANQTLLHDVRSGLPLPILARKHSTWHPGTVETYEAELRMLAEARMAVFRRVDPSAIALTWERGQFPLRDGRIAFVLDHDSVFSPDLELGTHQIRIDVGCLTPLIEEVRIHAIRRIQGGPAETVWSTTLDRTNEHHTSSSFVVQITEKKSLAIEVEMVRADAQLDPNARFWGIVEFRPRGVR